MNFDQKIKKLKAEGFLSYEGGTLTIKGWLSASEYDIHAGDGGYIIQETEFTFDRAGRRQRITLNLVDIVRHYHQLNYVTVELKIRKATNNKEKGRAT